MKKKTAEVKKEVKRVKPSKMGPVKPLQKPRVPSPDVLAVLKAVYALSNWTMPDEANIWKAIQTMIKDEFKFKSGLEAIVVCKLPPDAIELAKQNVLGLDPAIVAGKCQIAGELLLWINDTIANYTKFNPDPSES